MVRAYGADGLWAATPLKAYQAESGVSSTLLRKIPDTPLLAWNRYA